MFLPVNITLQFGDTGDFVAELQRRLSLINLFNEGFINATFDSNTVNAVKSFQSMQGLKVDGIAGPETLRRLNGVISGDTSTSSDSDKKEEEQAQQAAYLKTAALADLASAPAVDPMLTAAAPAVEEKAVEKPVEQKPVAAPPPRLDAQPDLQAQQQQQQIDAMKQQAIAQQQQQQPEPQTRQQDLDALKQLAEQQEAKKAAAKPPEPKQEQKQEAQQQPERKPLSAMLQKLVDYIESKLPRSVVDDVKAIGQNMLKAGVREAPEAGGAPAAPAIEAGRGQQQQTQRGG